MGFILRADIPLRKLSTVEVFTGIETSGKHFSDCHYSGSLHVQNSPGCYLLNNGYCCWGWSPFDLFTFCEKVTSIKSMILAWWRKGMNTKALILRMFTFPYNFKSAASTVSKPDAKLPCASATLSEPRHWASIAQEVSKRFSYSPDTAP